MPHTPSQPDANPAQQQAHGRGRGPSQPAAGGAPAGGAPAGGATAGGATASGALTGWRAIPSRVRGADIALVSSFAALIVVCSVAPAIHVSVLPVPVTLQTFGVLVAGAILGAGRGALAVSVYLALGFANAPIFAAGGAGLTVLSRPSAGFLLAFPLAAALTGYLTRVLARRLPVAVAMSCAVAAATLLIHACGVPVMAWRLGLGLTEALVADAVFLPGDILKAMLVVITASAVWRAFPDLARR